MKKSLVLCGMALAAAASNAQEVGRVISSTPVFQQVAVPRTVCNQSPMALAPSTSGAGGVLGAIAGGALGSQIGSGNGRAAATVLGVIGGALLGNQVEAGSVPLHAGPHCVTETVTENRAVAYNVTYEYGGQRHTVQMAQDPGPTIQLQVTPVGAAGFSAPTPPAPMVIAPSPGYRYGDAPPVAVLPPVILPPTVVAPVYYARPYAPVYYARPYYYPPVGVSINLGFSSGPRYHHHHRPHYWR